MCRVDLYHILRCIDIQSSRLVSVLNCIEIQYSRLLSILKCIAILYFIDVVFPCNTFARAFLCVSCLCWCSRKTCYLSVFSREIFCRKASNAEASQLKDRVNWKASRATSGAAYICELTISGVANQVGNLKLSWCRGPGNSLWSWEGFWNTWIELLVTLSCFSLPCLMSHSKGFSH